MTFWDWLSGKKTAIGAVLLAALQLIPQDVTVFAGIALYDIVQWLGNILVGGGLAHKAVKAKGGAAKVAMLFLLPFLYQGTAKAQESTWDFEPDLAVSLIKVHEKAELDGITASVFPSAGIGIAYRHIDYSLEEPSADIGFALDFFFGGDLGGQFLVSPTLRAEFFDGFLSIGGGYDIGYVGERSRFFGIFTSNFEGLF